MQDMTEYTCQPPSDERAAVSPGMPRGMRALFSVWPYRIIRIALAAVFIWSGVSKLFDLSSFALIMEVYGVVPDAWVMPVATTLPAIELVAGLALLADLRGSLAVVGGLLALFMVVLGYGIRLGLDVDCGCFGPEDPETWAYHGLRPALYRDFLMGAGVVYLYVRRYRCSAKPEQFLNYMTKRFKRRNWA